MSEQPNTQPIVSSAENPSILIKNHPEIQPNGIYSYSNPRSCSSLLAMSLCECILCMPLPESDNVTTYYGQNISQSSIRYAICLMSLIQEQCLCPCVAVRKLICGDCICFKYAKIHP